MEQNDRCLGREQQALLELRDMAVAAHQGQRRVHQGQRFFRAVLALAQALDDRFVARIGDLPAARILLPAYSL